MITKLATFRGVSPEGEPLVRLFEPGGRLIKEAGPIMPQIRQWMASYKPEDNKIAVLVNAMGASEYWGQNVNGDVFPERSLIHDCRNHPSQSHAYDDFTGKIIPPYGYWTFLNAHPFVHHRNKDPSRAFGHVALAVWNPKMHRVELIVILDKLLALQHGAEHVIDRILAGEYPDVSMGCRVPYDICTICGNKSKTRNDYCSCVKNIGMGKILDDGRRIGVINTYPRFFDISFVFIGADKTAKVMCKLASGIIVPQSVADAEYLYGLESDSPEAGLTKAAMIQVPHNFYWSHDSVKVAEPRIAGMSLEESDKILTGDPEDARFPPTEKDQDAWQEWLDAKKEQELGNGPVPKIELDQPKEASIDEPVLDVSINELISDGNKVRVVHRKAPPPEDVDVSMGRIDHQDDSRVESVADGALKTNASLTAEDEDTYDKPKTAEASLSDVFAQAKLIKIGPPPKPNRKEFPFTGTINFRGVIIHVENKPGTVREGKTPEGKVKWRTDMKLPYGEILGSLGTDGDKLDVYVGPNRNCDNVYIVHQNFTRGAQKGKYDEDKVMLGFDNFMQAKDAYLAHYDSPKYFRSMTVMAFPLFKMALKKKEVHGEKVASAYRTVVADMRLEDEFSKEGSARDILAVTLQNALTGGLAGSAVGAAASDKGDRLGGALRGALTGAIATPAISHGLVGASHLLRSGKIPYSVARRLDAALNVAHAPLMIGGTGAAAAAAGKTKEAFRVRTFQSRAEAAAVAEDINAKIPMEWLPVLGFIPQKDEDSGRYFLGHRPLSANEMKYYFGGKNKESMVKTAVRADLDHLFENSKNARRRERTWKDKVTGKETKEVGSGIAKTASDLSQVSPAVLKIATVLRQGWSASDLLKVSNAMKAASHLKWAEIVKQIGPGKATGRVTPLLSQTEDRLPKELLNELGERPDLEKSLATPSLMGMVLKPEEFQRIALTHMGKGELADKLDDANAVFKPSDEETCPCSALSSSHMDPEIMKALMPFLEGKSYVGPVVRRRITRIVVIKPKPEPPPTEVDSPLLSKVASAYTWYRREQMKLASDLPATVASHPELHAGVHALDTEGLFNKTASGELGLNRRSMAILLGTVPLSLMYSAHKRGEIRRGEDVGALGGLIAEHPWLTSMGVVTGLGALLRNPKAQQAVDEVFEAGGRIWRGKQAPTP